jgi:hypothetical protein
MVDPVKLIGHVFSFSVVTDSHNFEANHSYPDVNRNTRCFHLPHIKISPFRREIVELSITQDTKIKITLRPAKLSRLKAHFSVSVKKITLNI